MKYKPILLSLEFFFIAALSVRTVCSGKHNKNFSNLDLSDRTVPCGGICTALQKRHSTINLLEAQYDAIKPEREKIVNVCVTYWPTNSVHSIVTDPFTLINPGEAVSPATRISRPLL